MILFPKPSPEFRKFVSVFFWGFSPNEKNAKTVNDLFKTNQNPLTTAKVGPCPLNGFKVIAKRSFFADFLRVPK